MKYLGYSAIFPAFENFFLACLQLLSYDNITFSIEEIQFDFKRI